ncbi:hypothetical protein [Mycobacterium sp. SMC-13]|uniref:hypothetical protein n=1 Tax=Mycobacterium sp. SMC-13 TaxID=3381626 RepID=UPI003875D4F8
MASFPLLGYHCTGGRAPPSKNLVGLALCLTALLLQRRRCPKLLSLNDVGSPRIATAADRDEARSPVVARSDPARCAASSGRVAHPLVRTSRRRWSVAARFVPSNAESASVL